MPLYALFLPLFLTDLFSRLSWADTAASTIGRLWGPYTPPLPARVPILRLPFAPRKSLAGFLAACVTGALIAMSFWTWLAPVRDELSWTWEDTKFGGWTGLTMIGVVAGLVSGVAEALGKWHLIFLYQGSILILLPQILALWMTTSLFLSFLVDVSSASSSSFLWFRYPLRLPPSFVHAITPYRLISPPDLSILLLTSFSNITLLIIVYTISIFTPVDFRE